MNALIQSALLGLVTACACVILRMLKPEYAFVTGLAGSLCAFALAIPALTEIVRGIAQIAGMAGIEGEIALLLRACAIIVVCEFSAAACREANLSMLAGRIEFGGRAFVCAMALPKLVSLLGSLPA